MKTVLEKLKAFGILFLMIFACIGVVWVTNQFRGSSSYVVGSETALETPTISEMNEEILIQDTSVVNEIKDIENGTVKAVVTSGVYNCKDSDYVYIKSESTCRRDSNVGIDFKDDGYQFGNRVRVDADIVLSKVTVPLELLSGVEVFDSNRQITSETPTLKPAGEQIDNSLANYNLPPGQDIMSYKEPVEDEPFKFDYITAFLDLLSSPSEENQIGVEQEIPNACPHCNNQSNVNPDKSNKISEFLYDSMYRYPGQKDAISEDDAIEECSSSDNFTDWNDEYTACRLSYTALAIERIKRNVDWFAWIQNITKCEPIIGGIKNPLYDPEHCIDYHDIVVKMASPFGSDKDCFEDSACTNAFMDIRNKSVLSPNIDLGGKHYYLTTCKAFIQGLKDEVEIKCAWDMSHLFKERKFNEYNNIPAIESVPTDEEYEDFLLNTIQGSRGDAIDIQPGN